MHLLTARRVGRMMLVSCPCGDSEAFDDDLRFRENQINAFLSRHKDHLDVVVDFGLKPFEIAAKKP